MSRDTKALVTFVITMVAVWVSFWVYDIGYNFIAYDVDMNYTYGKIWGVFWAGILVVFPTYKFTKKYLWKK